MTNKATVHSRNKWSGFS